MRPVNLCERCNWCGARFSVEHRLSCKKGGLVCQYYDNTRDEAGQLAVMVFTASRLSYKPHIFYGRGVAAGIEAEDTSVPGNNVAHAGTGGNVAVHRLWGKGKTCILDIRITDTDTKLYDGYLLEKVLEKATKLKTDKYEAPYIERHRTFAPLVQSVDRMACKEAKAFEKCVALLMATKHD